MKKILMIIMVVFAMIGCGKKEEYKVYSPSEKREIIMEIIETPAEKREKRAERLLKPIYMPLIKAEYESNASEIVWLSNKE